MIELPGRKGCPSEPAEILITSIPHTGTHFCRDHLLAGRSFHITHFIWEFEQPAHTEKICAWMAMLPTIIPMRHPLAVAVSWKRRMRPLEQLPLAFQTLELRLDPLKPLYLPLDTPKREAFLDEIEKAIGGDPLPRDWPVIRGNEEKLGPAELTDAEAELMADMIARRAPFFRSLGYANSA